jgi:hypothetical protein
VPCIGELMVTLEGASGTNQTLSERSAKE